MISQMRFGTFFFVLTAWCWCLAGASAQEQRAPPGFDEGDQSADVARISNFPWDTIQWIERRYKVEAVRFKARDESGVDWLGSDEVIIGTYDAKGSTVSEEIGDIDSGDTHQFDPATSCIIAVRPGEVVLGQSSVCNDVGEPAPFGFRVEFWEKDNGLPGGFCAPLQPPPGGHAPPHCLNDNFDDFIGTAHLHFSARDLDAVLPNVGDEYVETTKLGGCPIEYSACGDFSFSDYTFTYRITRLSDVRVDVRSLLDETMQRSGARSDLEAIATGLRFLMRPSPYETEADTVNRVR